VAASPTTEARPRIVRHARPARYRSTAQWLEHGADRQSPAVIGALVAAWTAMPFALWLAVGGLAIGAFAGIVGGSEIGLAKTLHIEQGIGVIAAIYGAVIGTLAGFLVIYAYFVQNPAQLAGALISGALVGSLILVLRHHIEPFLMRLRGYREPSRRERVRLYPLLAETGERMGLTVVPALWISDAQKPGAWAHMRSIVLTRGLLGDYDASEKPPTPELDSFALSAILAHELHHWDAGDVVGLAAVSSCFWPVVLIVNAISWLRERAEWLAIVCWLFFWPAWVATKLVVVPLVSRRSRDQEYEADARAASLGDDYRLGLRRALDELAAWERPRTGWEDVLAATHPPIELRLERLEAPRQPEPPPPVRRVPEPTTATPPPMPLSSAGQMLLAGAARATATRAPDPPERSSAPAETPTTAARHHAKPKADATAKPKAPRRPARPKASERPKPSAPRRARKPAQPEDADDAAARWLDNPPSESG